MTIWQGENGGFRTPGIFEVFMVLPGFFGFLLAFSGFGIQKIRRFPFVLNSYKTKFN